MKPRILLPPRIPRPLRALCPATAILLPARALHTTAALPSSKKGRPSGLPPHVPKEGLNPHSIFTEHNILSGAPTPQTSIDELYPRGFLLASGERVTNVDGVMLLGSEVFTWKPKLRAGKGGKTFLWGLEKECYGPLEVMYPKPELLVIGTGKKGMILDKEDRAWLEGMGIRVEVQDSRNASSLWNLLATERPGQVGAAIASLGL